jgi:uncharacterized protein (DUF1684 family)
MVRGVALIFLAFVFAGTGARADVNSADTTSLDQWRQQRVKNLTSETGWLTLVGLFWLKSGDNTFGRATSNRITLEHAALANTLGTFTVQNGAVQFVTNTTATVSHNGKPVTSIAMTSDTAGEPTTLAAGSLRFFVIERAGRMGVRVRDVHHPARKNFRGIESFPASEDWIVNARYEPYPANRRIPIVNILGMTDQMVTPGAVVFTKNGREWRLDTILETPDDDELFVMFADGTSARETYGAGRFIYIPLPRDGRVTVDFNRAYNPPCAFNEFATCPLPPPQNRLGMRVEAGEKKYIANH